MTLALAASNLDKRHKAITGKDQKINFSSLTDYHSHIIKGLRLGYKFNENPQASISDLRKVVKNKGLQKCK